MNRTELINTLNILKNDKGEQKGFSFRRTIKTLHDYKKNQVIYEYYNQLVNGGAENGREREKIP